MRLYTVFLVVSLFPASFNGNAWADPGEMGAMPPTAAPAAAPMPAGGMGMMDDDKSEMGCMGMGCDKMEMVGMMGMAGGGEMPQSVVPGSSGVSSLYHIGATGFFLDHPQHITLSTQQQLALNHANEQALLAKNTADRAIAQAEQELWTLTAAAQPDTAKIKAQIARIATLNGDARLAFIHAVGEASKLLTDEQRKILIGFAPPAPATATPAPAAAMPMDDM